MRYENNNELNQAFVAVLKPIARLFLRFGRGFREFSDLSKAAFVAVALKDYGVGGRPTNRSRIAAMTGLTRREISRIRTQIEAGEAYAIERGTPIREVIAGWQSDPDYLDASGMPAALPLTGKTGSFRALVRRYAGDIPEGAMRKELERVSAIDTVDDTLRLRFDDSDTVASERQMAAELRAGPYPLLTAIAHNQSVDDEDDRWPVANIGHTLVRKSDLPHVRQLVSQRLYGSTRHVSDLLSAYEQLEMDEKKKEPLVPVAAGVYYAEVQMDSDV